MIKLKDNDLLWRGYNRYYQGSTVPHPHSVCNLFWKALGGLCKWLFWDSWFWLMAPLSVGLLWLLISNFGHFLRNEHSPLVGVPAALAMLSVGTWCIFYIVCRHHVFWEGKSQKAQIVGAFVFAISFFTFFLSFAMSAHHKEPWGPIHLLHAFLMILGVLGSVAVIVGGIVGCSYFFSSTVWAYFYSYKDWVCPLVQTPEGFAEPPPPEPIDEATIPKTYSIPVKEGSLRLEFPTSGHLLRCSKCNQKILVEIALLGVNHNASVRATCCECLFPLNGEFATAHPEIAKQLTDWQSAEQIAKSE